VNNAIQTQEIVTKIGSAGSNHDLKSVVTKQKCQQLYKRMQTLIFKCLLNSTQICEVWRANSRVGTMMRAWMTFNSVSIFSMHGMQ
jgi:hypothetical protein